MFILKGKLKIDETKDYTRKDGVIGRQRTLYIEPTGSIYPVAVSASDLDVDYGQEGDEVEIEVKIFPYNFIDGKRKRALSSVYIPKQ
jgi:hypothetical protein